MSARIPFDNTASPYIAQRIITNGVFDPAKYAAYSPVFMPTTLALSYGAAFAAFPAVFTHIFCELLFLPAPCLIFIMSFSMVSKGYYPEIPPDS